LKKKREKTKKKDKREKLAKKEGGRITVDYCWNPQWFRCGGTMIPPHHLDSVIMVPSIHVFIPLKIISVGGKYLIHKITFIKNW